MLFLWMSPTIRYVQVNKIPDFPITYEHISVLSKSECFITYFINRKHEFLLYNLLKIPPKLGEDEVEKLNFNSLKRIHGIILWKKFTSFCNLSRRLCKSKVAFFSRDFIVFKLLISAICL